ncbi:MAG: hypothetical protein R3C18_13375 [Planctomycetaceae bacterium]
MEKQIPWRAKLVLGVFLLSLFASHGVIGLLANLGWYSLVDISFDAWYMHPAYQSVCWFGLGIAMTILFPMWVSALLGPKKGVDGGSSGI